MRHTIARRMTTVIDLHVHTTRGSSDSNLSPEDMVTESRRLGVTGLCITEHNNLWDRHEFNAFAYKHDLLLIRGVEVDTDMGHVLVFGMEEYVSGISRIAELRRVVDRAKGFMITAHPFRGIHSPGGLRRPYLYRDTPTMPDTVEEASEHAVFGYRRRGGGGEREHHRQRERLRPGCGRTFGDEGDGRQRRSLRPRPWPLLHRLRG